MVPPATTFSRRPYKHGISQARRGRSGKVLDDKKSFRRAGLAVRTLQRQSTEALKRMHAKKAPPVRYVDYKYQSSGTLITTSSSRRRSSIPPPKAPSDPLICRSLAKLVPKRRTFRLPVYPKSTAQLARLDKASEDVPLFSGASGDVHFGIGPNKLDLKQALFLAMESKFSDLGSWSSSRASAATSFSSSSLGATRCGSSKRTMQWSTVTIMRGPLVSSHSCITCLARPPSVAPRQVGVGR